MRDRNNEAIVVPLWEWAREELGQPGLCIHGAACPGWDGWCVEECEAKAHDHKGPTRTQALAPSRYICRGARSVPFPLFEGQTVLGELVPASHNQDRGCGGAGLPKGQRLATCASPSSSSARTGGQCAGVQKISARQV